MIPRALAGAVAAMVLVGAGPPTRSSGPILLGEGVVSSPADEFGGAITPDGKTIYFTRSVPRSYLYSICAAHWLSGKWTSPEVLPFSGRWRDSDPVLSPHGERLYFVSDRPVAGKVKADFDMFVCDRSQRGWSEPRDVGNMVNSDANEYFVSEAADRALYFTSARKGSLGPIDVWLSRRTKNGAYDAPENLGAPVNGAGIANIEALIAPDRSFLILGSFGRERNPFDSNLYVSESRGGRWSPPRPLSKLVNSPVRDYSPRFSPDFRNLIFTSERAPFNETVDRRLTYEQFARLGNDVLNGLGNIYQIPLHEAGLPEVRR